MFRQRIKMKFVILSILLVLGVVFTNGFPQGIFSLISNFSKIKFKKNSERHEGVDKLPNTRPYNYYLPDKDAFIQTEYLYIPDLDIYAYKKPNIAFKLPISHPNRERFEKDLDLLLGRK